MANNLNLLNFKFGPQARLPQDKAAGTVYVTTDEQALYIDLPNDDGQLGRLRIGDIIVVDSAKTAQPPFSIGFYYFIEDNALLRWDGSAWTQINTVSDVESKINALTKTVESEINRSQAADTEHNNAISALQAAMALRVTTQAFEEFKEDNTEAIAAAKQAGIDASAEAKAADVKAGNANTLASEAKAEALSKLPLAGGTMTGAINMGTYKITSLGTPVNNADAATKLYVDTAKNAALTAAENAMTAAENAQDKADQAYALGERVESTANEGKAKAEEAYTLASQKTTMADVEAKNYATKTEAQGYVNVLKGSNKDDEKTISVYGAFAAAAKAQKAAEDAEKVANGKTTMAEVEAKNYATKTEAQNMANAVLGSSANSATDYTVYGAHKAAANALEKALKGISDASTAKAAADGAQGTANSAYALAEDANEKAENAQKDASQALTDAEKAQTTIDNYIDARKNDYTNTQIDGLIAAAEDVAEGAQQTANTARAEAKVADDKAVAADAKAVAADAKAVAADAKAVAAQNTIDQYATAHANDYTNAQIDKKVSDVSTVANSALSTAQNALPKAGGQMNANAEIKMNNGSITGLADLTSSSNGKMAANKNYVDAAIAAGIQANDAMTFKGTLGNDGNSTASSLPNTAQKGDTYKVAVRGIYAGIDAKVGDLFINVAADNATANWTHISSGYEDDYLQKLIISDNTIYLTDGIANTIGTNGSGSVSNFTLVGNENSNLVFEVSQADQKITITGSMVWGSF